MNRFLFLTIVSASVYFSNLWGTSVYILDEARNAACAMEMKLHGAWIVPTFNGVLRTDKPPLHYFAMMAAYHLFGVTPFAARFFSALAGVLLILLIYSQVKEIINEKVACYAAFMLLASVQLTIQFHLAVPDPYLILFFTAALFFFYRGYIEEKRKYLRVFYASLALAFLAKGLIAVVLPGFIILLFLMMRRELNWTMFSRVRFVEGVLLFMLVAIPWYVAVGIATEGEWLRGFFLEHNFQRYTSTMEGHHGFFMAPLVILIVALLPFSIVIVPSVVLSWKERKKHSFLLFALIVCFVIAIFFSFSKTILPSYPAPAIPFLSVILAFYLYQWIDLGKAPAFASMYFLIVLVICLAIGAGVYIALKQEEGLSELATMAACFLVLPVGVSVGWFFYSRSRRRIFFYSWVISWMLIGQVFFYAIYPRIDKRNPVVLSLRVVTKAYPERKWIAFRQFNPAFVFAHKQEIPVYKHSYELKNLSYENEKILLITRSSYLPDIPEEFKLVYRCKDLFEDSETVLMIN